MRGAILISDEIDRHYGADIASAAPGRARVVVHPDGIDGDPATAEVAFFSNELFPGRAGEFLRPVIQSVKAGSLAWFHTFSAGVDDAFFQGLLERGVRLSTSSGAMAVPIAHSVVLHLLTFAHRLQHFRDAQRRRAWEPRNLRELEGSLLGVVGLGPIGVEVARLGAALRMRVVGFRRSPRGDEPCETVPIGDLHAWLPRIDHLVLALPLNEDSEKLIDEPALARLKPEAVLVNIARGGVVDEAALVRALQAGRLAGAALDVFETEPLPEDSPLWSLPNVVVTPHCSGDARGNQARAVAIFVDNLARYEQGEPLRNEVTAPAPT